MSAVISENIQPGAEKKEFWRWQENVWVDEAKDWRSAKAVTVGIDVGSVSSQCVVVADGQLYAYNSMRTGNNSPDSASDAFKGVAEKSGKVTNFLMNDKCAAGTGRGMEVISDLMQIPIAELGPRSFDVDVEPEAVSSVCVVFAKSEALGLLKAGYTKNKVIAAYCQAMAERVVSLLERIGVEEGFFITGGIAKNPGVVRRIEKILGIKAMETAIDSQIAGALGAALFAHTLVQKQGPAKPMLS